MSAEFDGLLGHLADQLAEPTAAGPECQAVWRDPTDRALVACADNAEPGSDWCEWHQDRSHGRLLWWLDRSEAVRVQYPDPADVRGRRDKCCDSHNQHCEPPSELCCRHCTEVSHDMFPIRHGDGTPCVMDSATRATDPKE